jgi:hypothetical protein
MAGSRVPGPTGMNDPDDGQSGLLGDGDTPGPLGHESGSSHGAVPLEAGSEQKKKPKAASTELSLVGSYPKPVTWTAKKEKELIGQDTWFPHTLDFLAVAGKGSLEITTPEDFLLKIIEASGSIGRLNYFSHGVTGKIATSGKIDPGGTFCTLDTGWTQVTGQGRKNIADPYAKTWGDIGENSGSVTITVGNRTFSLDDVRKKFKEDAELWLYICHGGTDGRLLQNIANTFQVKVKAFSKIIVYCAPSDFPTSRQHKVNTLTGSKPSESCSGAVSDFHQLASDAGASPEKP